VHHIIYNIASTNNGVCKKIHKTIAFCCSCDGFCINRFIFYVSRSKQFHSTGRRAIHFRLCDYRTGERPEQEVRTKDKPMYRYNMSIRNREEITPPPPPTTHRPLVIDAYLQVHLRGDGVLLEMVVGSVRGYAEHRKRPRGVRATWVHRRRVEHERRGSFKLLVHRRPIHLGSKVNNERVRFLLGARKGRSRVSSSPARLIIIVL